MSYGDKLPLILHLYIPGYRNCCRCDIIYVNILHMSHKHIDMTRPLWLKVQYCPDVASYFSPYARLKVTVMGIFLTQT